MTKEEIEALTDAELNAQFKANDTEREALFAELNKRNLQKQGNADIKNR